MLFLVTATSAFKILNLVVSKLVSPQVQAPCVSWCYCSQTSHTEFPSPARCIASAVLTGVLGGTDTTGPASTNLFVCKSDPVPALDDVS